MYTENAAAQTILNHLEAIAKINRMEGADMMFNLPDLADALPALTRSELDAGVSLLAMDGSIRKVRNLVYVLA